MKDRGRSAPGGVAVVGIVVAVIVGVLGCASAGAAGGAPQRTDTSLVEHAVLHLSDLPSGWSVGADTATLERSRTKRDQVESGIPQCRVFQKLERAVVKLPGVRSPSFKNADQSVQNSMRIFPSAAQAKSGLKELASSDSFPCLELATKKLLAASSTSSSPAVKVLGVSVRALGVKRQGDQTLALQMATDLTVGGKATSIVTLTEFVRVGAIAVQFTFQYAQTPFPDLEFTIVNDVIGRLHEPAQEA